MSTSHPFRAGGFLSPPLSTPSTPSTTHRNTILPHPRPTPLRPGGTKESTFIRAIDTRILHIQRRFAKRTTPSSAYLSDMEREHADTLDDVQGYASMGAACADVDALVRVVWISGTPSLQVPYLITLATLVANFVQAMPPAPRALFRSLRVLDLAFASLFTGRDVGSGERLPGFERGRAVSGTEKVRIRSLVERSRVYVVEAFKKGEFAFEGDGERDEGESVGDDRMDVDRDEVLDGELVLEGEDLVFGEGMEEEEEEDAWDMQIARVYDHTLVELGGALEEPNIGIITETRG